MSDEPPLVLAADGARDGGRAVLWDPDFAKQSPLFWPIADAAAALVKEHGDSASFPTPETIDAALGARAGIRFERQRPVSRRRRPDSARSPNNMYDARIAREGCVPTRPGSWHDLMNALVWATFPTAKRALHARQHALVVPAAPGESARRPRELDALALLDEGGVVVVSHRPLADEDALVEAIAASEAKAVVFGHAIYEGMVLGRAEPLASVVCVDGAPGEVDGALAAVLADRSRLVDPRALLRLRVGQALEQRP